MLKLTFCLRRLPTLTVSEFQSYWLDNHAELVRRHANPLRIRKYGQSHTFDDPRLTPVIESRRGRIEPFDGVAQIWWDSIDDLLDTFTTAEGRAAGKALRNDEETFIDLANSPLFFSHEHSII